jgi:anaerobic selenocysteine-containing dehydrogenase
LSSAPTFTDHWDVTENTDAQHPFRLTTSPSRSFLNSTFNETESSLKKEGRPEVMMHQDDAAKLDIANGDLVRISNHRGTVTLHVALRDIMQPGVMIAEGIWPNTAYRDGKGINQLTSDEPIAPHGGAAFHDTHVQIEKVG